MRGLFAATLAGLALGAAGGTQAASVPAYDNPPLLIDADFFWGGRTYCWYDGGWHGPGFYWCGYAWRRGFGWGGGWGWHGWRGGYGRGGRWSGGGGHWSGGGVHGSFRSGGHVGGYRGGGHHH